MTTAQAEFTSVASSTAWQPSSPKKGEKTTYGADDVIHAFETGVQTGAENKIKEIGDGLNQALKDNKALTAEMTYRVVTLLKERKLEVVSAHLKIESWQEFEVLVLVKEEDFLKAEFDEIYTVAYDLEKAASKEKGTYVTFAFAPHNENTNMKCVRSDGFSLTHIIFDQEAKKKKASNSKPRVK